MRLDGLMRAVMLLSRFLPAPYLSLGPAGRDANATALQDAQKRNVGLLRASGRSMSSRSRTLAPSESTTALPRSDAAKTRRDGRCALLGWCRFCEFRVCALEFRGWA